MSVEAFIAAGVELRVCECPSCHASTALAVPPCIGIGELVCFRCLGIGHYDYDEGIVRLTAGPLSGQTEPVALEHAEHVRAIFKRLYAECGAVRVFVQAARKRLEVVP